MFASTDRRAFCAKEQAGQTFSPSPAAAVDTRQVLSRIAETLDLLSQGSSVNSFNRRVLPLLRQHIASLTEGGKVSSVEDCEKVKHWFLHLVTNQNYCSPSVPTENTVHQAGLINISKYIKYLRSELNTSAFGEPYERNVALIRAESAGGFADIASRYIVVSDRKEPFEAGSNWKELSALLESERVKGCMPVLEINPSDFGLMERELSKVFQGSFCGGIYLRVQGGLTASQKADLQKLLLEKGSKAQLLVEENYDPFSAGSSSIRKVTFLHNQQRRFRYQLLQDGASMGFRPSLDDVVEYYFSAGKLSEIINRNGKTEDSLSKKPAGQLAASEGPDFAEKNGDYRILGATVENCLSVLEETVPADALDRAIHKLCFEEALQVRERLKSVLSDGNAEVKEIAEAFHESYYRLRTLLQYTAGLNRETREEIEEKIAGLEGGEVIACNSGMSAARSVITLLAARAGQVVSTAHYWETDFLVENLCSDNPHYPEVKQGHAKKLKLISHDLDEPGIEKLVDSIAEENEKYPGGQLLCLDRSIAPFFFTKIFNLEKLSSTLSAQAQKIRNPLYLVVDNTLDFDSVTAAGLFPRGIPENVFLVFTPSQAKLHQLGFDFATGGLINIYCNDKNRPEALRLRAAFEQKLKAESSCQSDHQAKLLDTVFYSHYRSGTMADYLGFMIGKRHRNAPGLMSQIASGLGELVQSKAAGLYEFSNPKTGGEEIVVPDPEDSSRQHKVKFSFHYEPKSNIHAYLKILEGESDRYIAGPLFEEIKRRVFKTAAAEGIHLADGTSWGFPITRMDWYMHTMRIAVGLEHNRTLSRLGTIMSSVIKELLLYPETFLKGVEVEPMSEKAVRENPEALLKLDRLIPHDPSRPTPVDYYLEGKDGKWNYSFLLKDKGELASMLLAFKRPEDPEDTVYLSKTATAQAFQGRGYFRRMFEHLKDRARAEGMKKILLQTSASRKNEYVVRAYEKCGFKAVGLRAEIQSNGWPLIMVDMEYDLSQGGKEAAHPFAPVTDEIYSRIKESGTLEGHGVVFSSLGKD